MTNDQEAGASAHIQLSDGGSPVTEAAIIDTVDSLQTYASIVTELANEKGYWFRGTRSASHSLTPSLHRHPTTKDEIELLRLEWDLITDFRRHAPPFSARLPEQNLELLFLMQHFGVPTRLLDWSENPFVALFFALEDARSMSSEEEDASVWILDPVGLNAVATSHLRGVEPQIFSAYAGEVEGYLPTKPDTRPVSTTTPLSIYGVFNSPRIVAQRGTFVLFGRDTTPLNHLKNVSGSAGIVRKIVLRGKAKRKMFVDLFNIGTSDSVIYPDLDGLGRELRNRRGF